MLNNMQEFAYWMARNFGLKSYIAEAAQFVWPMSYVKQEWDLDPQTLQVGTICMSSYFNKELMPQYCLDALNNSLYPPPL